MYIYYYNVHIDKFKIAHEVLCQLYWSKFLQTDKIIALGRKIIAISRKASRKELSAFAKN